MKPSRFGFLALLKAGFADMEKVLTRVSPFNTICFDKTKRRGME
jgi:hypothetical protein